MMADVPQFPKDPQDLIPDFDRNLSNSTQELQDFAEPKELYDLSPTKKLFYSHRQHLHEVRCDKRKLEAANEKLTDENHLLIKQNATLHEARKLSQSVNTTGLACGGAGPLILTIAGFLPDAFVNGKYLLIGLGVASSLAGLWFQFLQTKIWPKVQ